MWRFQICDTPFQGNVILNTDSWRRLWTRFGPARARASQKVFFLISMEWSAEKGIRRSGSQVPVNTFVSLAACTSLPCIFSSTLHLNLRHFDCLSADFISPLLLSSEASLWRWQIKLLPLLKSGSVALLTTHVSLHCFACLFADSLLLFHEAVSGKALQYQQMPNLENHEVNFSDALAMPTRDTRHPGRRIWHIQVFWWQAR